jgi:phosphate transport system protein
LSEVPQALRREYRAQVAALEDRILETGNRILEMLDVAMDALVAGEGAQAAAVTRADALVDQAHDRMRQDIFLVMAMQAPVAGELRLLNAFLHINMHLGRMGDLCVNIARSADLVGGLAGDEALTAQLREMGRHARTLIQRSLDALARRDADAARDLAALDDPLDRLNRGLFRRLVDLAAGDETRLDWAMRMVLVSRYLERLGDHAVDIGENMIFAVTGETGGVS